MVWNKYSISDKNQIDCAAMKRNQELKIYPGVAWLRYSILKLLFSRRPKTGPDKNLRLFKAQRLSFIQASHSSQGFKGEGFGLQVCGDYTYGTGYFSRMPDDMADRARCYYCKS